MQARSSNQARFSLSDSLSPPVRKKVKSRGEARLEESLEWKKGGGTGRVGKERKEGTGRFGRPYLVKAF